MEELLPVVAGMLIGLGVYRFVPGRMKSPVFVVLSIVCGVGASWINGELAVSWIYVVIDVAQVLFAGAMMWVLAARWQTVRARLRWR